MSRNPEFELFIASLEELDRPLAALADYSGGTWVVLSKVVQEG